MTLQNYLSYFDHLVKNTEELFKMVPPDKLDWKPTETSFSVGQQMAHIAGALGVYGRGISSGEWGFQTMRERFMRNRHTPVVTVEEAIKALHENYAEFRERIGGLSEDAFNHDEVFSPQFGGTVPRWRIAMLGVEHHINHKAKLFMYLKILGIRVHSGHLYRG